MSDISTAAQFSCIDIYDPITPGSFQNIFSLGETICGIRLIDDKFYIILQGTTSLAGWLANIDITPVDHGVLGYLHEGFHKNVHALVEILMHKIPNKAKVIVSGHSKGAAEASQLSAELYLMGVTIEQCILFACPNPGDEKFSDFMRKNIPGISYRNSPSIRLFGDPVTQVPLLPYVHVYPHTMISKEPKTLWDRLFPTERHHPQLYYDACKFL